MKDSEFLFWIYNRLLKVHGEDEYYDYMHRLKKIVLETEKRENPVKIVYADMCYDHDDEDEDGLLTTEY